MNSVLMEFLIDINISNLLLPSSYLLPHLFVDTQAKD